MKHSTPLGDEARRIAAMKHLSPVQRAAVEILLANREFLSEVGCCADCLAKVDAEIARARAAIGAS